MTTSLEQLNSEALHRTTLEEIETGVPKKILDMGAVGVKKTFNDGFDVGEYGPAHLRDDFKKVELETQDLIFSD